MLKRKFKILKLAPKYSIDTQIDLILTLIALFNFIRIEEGDENVDLEDSIEAEEEDIQPSNIQPFQGSNRRGRMDILRDRIAEDMWKDYQQYINRERD